MASAALPDESLFATIDESAKNTRQILYVYLGLISYAAITVIGASDRELVLNGTVRLPIVDANIRLSLFYFLCPALVMLAFTHLQLHIIELKHLLARVPDAGQLDRRAYPWLLVRSLLLLDRRVPARFGDRLGVALTIGSAYLSLPCMLAVFAVSYARTHAPVLTYLLALLAPGGCIVAAGFFTQVANLDLHDIRRTLARRPLPIALSALATVCAFTAAWEYILAVLFYLTPFLVMISLALLLAALIVRLGPLLRKRAPRQHAGAVFRSLLAFSWLLFLTSVCVFISALVHDGPGAATACIGLVIGLHLYGCYGAALLALQRPMPVVSLVAGAVLLACACLLHLVWLSNDGKGLALDLSHQNLAARKAADGDEAPGTPINLQAARLEGANFTSAILDGALLNKALLRNANFRGARLDGADLSGADLAGADFTRASLRRATLSSPASLRAARFDHARLDGADIRDVDFDNASLRETRFDGARLVGVTLRATRNLTAAQVLVAKELSYSYMSEEIERKVIDDAPGLLFEASLVRFDSVEQFVFTLLDRVPDIDNLSRAALCDRAGYAFWQSPGEHGQYRKQAYEEFACKRTVEKLLLYGVLNESAPDHLALGDVAPVRAARERQRLKGRP